MGVMPCARRGCENILCDRYSRTHGYICGECYSQLLNTSLSIEYFMETDKNSTILQEHDRSEELEAEFVYGG